MKKNFWTELKPGFLVLAPMEDVTDTVMRQMMLVMGKPEVMFTEFVNVDAICFAVRHAQNPCSTPTSLRSRGPAARGFVGMPALQRLDFSEAERPVVAQIWGTDPEKFYEAAVFINELGYDGIDINMGCPVRDVVKIGACSALIDNPELAVEIIRAVKRAAPQLPVSVKTRTGVNKPITEMWAERLLGEDLQALTIHGRTAKEMSKVPAHWDEIAKVVKLKEKMGVHTAIIGNGDVESRAQAEARRAETGVDGVMIGRGVFKNPRLFAADGDRLPTRQERIEYLKAHTRLWQEYWGESRHFAVLKKFVKMYINGWEGAGEERARLMESKSLTEFGELLDAYL